MVSRSALVSTMVGWIPSPFSLAVNLSRNSGPGSRLLNRMRSCRKSSQVTSCWLASRWISETATRTFSSHSGSTSCVPLGIWLVRIMMSSAPLLRRSINHGEVRPHFDVCKTFHVSLKCLAKRAVGERHIKPNPQPAGFAAAGDTRIGQERFKIVEDAPGTFEEDRAGVGWTKTMAMVLKQRDPYSLFQIADPPAYRGGLTKQLTCLVKARRDPEPTEYRPNASRDFRGR